VVTRTDKLPFGNLNISTFGVSLLKADNQILTLFTLIFWFGYVII